jgi:hypothetical protein
MAKFEQIDRLIDQAVEGSRPAAKANSESGTQELRVSPEAALPAGRNGTAANPGTEATESPVPPVETAAAGLTPRPSQSERTRQLFGAIRPFLPVMGGALRLIDHGAAQAASRLLPLLAGAVPAAPSAGTAENRAALETLAALEKERGALRAELDLCQEQLRSHEDRLVKLRDALTRTLAEQDTMQLALQRLTERNRLLTAGLVILLMLVIAGVMLVQITGHS